MYNVTRQLLQLVSHGHGITRRCLHSCPPTTTSTDFIQSDMKVVVKHWHAVAQWRWDTGVAEAADEEEGDVCGICRVPFEGCCPSCKIPGDDCPLSKLRHHGSSCYDIQICLYSMGRMQPHLSYALFDEVDRNGGV